MDTEKEQTEEELHNYASSTMESATEGSHRNKQQQTRRIEDPLFPKDIIFTDSVSAKHAFSQNLIDEEVATGDTLNTTLNDEDEVLGNKFFVCCSRISLCSQ